MRVDLTLVGVVRVRPAHLKLLLYAWDEAAAQFVRPSGALSTTTVGWCRTNGFDEVRPAEQGGQPVYAGPWWEEMEAIDRARALAHVALASEERVGQRALAVAQVPLRGHGRAAGREQHRERKHHWLYKIP